jgi:acetyl/propionyl-CoA carboxylase alpha subunit
MEGLKKILIANRGEIALRILRSAHAMGIKTVAVFSKGEENAPHVTEAGETVSLGEGQLGDTYLNIGKIIDAALTTGADAIHPGYGFLSESYLLAEACQNNGLRFTGPSPDVLRLMGNKLEAKTLAESLNIPVLRDITVSIDKLHEIATISEYPVLVKAAHGGGGKGMQVIRSAQELEDKILKAARMARSYFGNGEVYLEPYIENARHIEVQILGDHHGNLVHLYERDCSAQRNHQKIVEEAPAPNLPAGLRKSMIDAAMTLCRAVNYTSAGTVEFLLDSRGSFFFMEMNPRIQVEHPVTEEITRIDIVQEQLRIAAGFQLSFSQEEVTINGHAIEVRIYAEDPEKDFSPSPTPVSFFRLPWHNGVRIETDLQEHTASTGNQFDPLLCKIIAHGENRDHALAILNNALHHTIIDGPVTNRDFLIALLQQDEMKDAHAHTRLCHDKFSFIRSEMVRQKQDTPVDLLIAAYLFLKFLPENSHNDNPWQRMGFRNILKTVNISIDGHSYNIPYSQLPLAGKAMPRNTEAGINAARTAYFSFRSDAVQIFARVEKGHAGSVRVSTGDEQYEIFYSEGPNLATALYLKGYKYLVTSADLLECYPESSPGDETNSDGDKLVRSPLHGKVIGIQVKNEQLISKGDLLLIIESMKSENHITSPRNARIKSIEVSVGTQVTDQTTLITLEES